MGKISFRMEVWFDGPVDAEYIELMEDQTEGQHVLEWVVETRWPAYWCTKDGLDRWVPLAQGQSIGHKRIIPLGKMRGYAFRVRILKSLPGMVMRSMRVYGRKVPMQFHDSIDA